MSAIDGDPLRSDTKKRPPLLQRQPKKGVKMIYHQLQKKKKITLHRTRHSG